MAYRLSARYCEVEYLAMDILSPCRMCQALPVLSVSDRRYHVVEEKLKGEESVARAKRYMYHLGHANSLLVD